MNSNFIFKVIFFCIFCIQGSAALPAGVPFRVIAFRHGEKNTSGPNIPLAPTSQLPVFPQGLDVVGYQRSIYLVGYVLGTPDNTNYMPAIPGNPPLFADLIMGASPHHPITRIAALGPDQQAGPPLGTGTWRPLQTITPLANAVFPSDAVVDPYNYRPTNSLVYQVIDDQPAGPGGDYTDLINEITNGTNDDKTVVLCWESNRLPFMLAALDAGITGHVIGDPNSVVMDPNFIDTFGTYPNLTFPLVQGQKPFNLTFVIQYFDDGGTLRSNFTSLDPAQEPTSFFTNTGGQQ